MGGRMKEKTYLIKESEIDGMVIRHGDHCPIVFKEHKNYEKGLCDCPTENDMPDKERIAYNKALRDLKKTAKEYKPADYEKVDWGQQMDDGSGWCYIPVKFDGKKINIQIRVEE